MINDAIFLFSNKYAYNIVNLFNIKVLMRLMVLFSPLFYLCDIINPYPGPLILHVSDSNPESILPDIRSGFHILDHVTHIFLCENKKRIHKHVLQNQFMATLHNKF